MSLLDTQEIKLGCPSCKHQFSEPISRLKNNPTLHCPHCKQQINIDAQGLRDGLKGVDSALADLARTIKGAGKR